MISLQDTAFARMIYSIAEVRGRGMLLQRYIVAILLLYKIFTRDLDYC